MKDKHDPRSIGDMNNDGVTGHSMGTANRGNWITENLGKTIIVIVAVIIILSISAILSTDNNGEDSDSLGSQQGQATGN